MHVQLVCNTDIIGRCWSTITTWGRRGYSIIHMILGFLEIVGFYGNLIFDRWVETQVNGGVMLVFLKVFSEDI